MFHLTLERRPATNLNVKEKGRNAVPFPFSDRFVSHVRKLSILWGSATAATTAAAAAATK
jgi:hypothetical protein